MTVIEYKKENGQILIRAQGHANYKPRGEDIVCAAISFGVQAIAMYAVKSGTKVVTDIQPGESTVIMTETDTTSACAEMVMMGLRELQDIYPEFVCIAE